MAFKVINNSIDPDSLIPTLLVFKAYLYIVEFDISNPIIIQQVIALKKAIEEVRKPKAKY